MKKFFGLIGYPLKHTLSDKIHKYLFDLNHVDAVYEIKEIRPCDLKNEIASFKNYLGFNVTIPYKTDIIKYLDDIDEIAKKCNAVNTVLNKNGRLIGYNTDIFGFDKSIKFHQIPLFSKKYKVCLIGLGGVGKTILYYLFRHNVDVTVYVRNCCMEYIRFIQGYNEDILIEDLNQIRGQYDLLINATPVGMFPNIDEMVVNESFLDNISYIYDLIYNPSITRLMEKGLQHGCKVFNGENMLMWQAIKAQEIWLKDGVNL